MKIGTTITNTETGEISTVVDFNIWSNPFDLTGVGVTTTPILASGDGKRYTIPTEAIRKLVKSGYLRIG